MLYCRKGTLKFEKESEYGPSKIAVYSTIVWAEATLQFDEWRECFKDDKSVKRLVHGDYNFVSSIWARNNVRYSGIHRLNDKGEIIPRTGLNMDNFEWINVMKKVEDINVALYGNQAARGEKRRSNEVHVWRYIWYLNGEEVEVDGSDVKYFTENDAKRLGEVHKQDLVKKLKLKKQDVLEMKVCGEFVERPSELLQMRMVLHQCVKSGVEICKYKNCPACQQDSPGQKSHMALGGCLDPANMGSCHTDFVLSAIEPEDLVAVYCTVCRFLGVSPSPATLLSKAILSWISSVDVGHVIDAAEDDDRGEEVPKHELLNKENSPLFKLILDIFYDLNMPANLEKRLAEKMPSK